MKQNSKYTHINADHDVNGCNTTITDFSHCNDESLEYIEIDDAVEEICYEAFCNCKNLKAIKFPKNLKRIGADAFSGCTSLKEVILPDTVQYMDKRVFADCTRLEKAVLPKKMLSIDQSTFAGCKRLKDVSLPENLHILPAKFFLGCESLDIELPENYISLSYSAFQGCSSLTHFPKYAYNFGQACFKNCSSLTNVKLHDETIVLDEEVFCNCKNLSEITSPHKVRIDKATFKGCVSLKKIPNFVKNYDECSFENCEGLTEIDIISSSIPAGCFKGCKNISKINHADKIRTINHDAFNGCSSLTTIDLPNLENIAAVAFEGCTSLKEANLGDSLTLVSNGLFTNCTSLEKVSIPNTVTTMGNKVFYNCKSLKSIKLPNSLEAIGREVFVNCGKISSIYIPSNVHTMQNTTFIEMPSLRKVGVSKRNKHFYSPDNKVIIDNLGQCIFLYARGLEDETYSVTNLVVSYEADGTEVITAINGIRPYAFYNAKNLKKLCVPSCTEKVDFSTFIGCDNLKTLEINRISLYSGVSMRVQQPLMVGDNVDGKKYKITKEGFIPFTELIINGDEGFITSYAFNEFKRLETLKLDEGLNAIHSLSFTGCSNLKEVNIPDSVKTIDKNSFLNGTSLRFSNGIVADGSLQLTGYKYSDSYKQYDYNGKYIIQDGDKLVTYDEKKMKKKISNYEFVENDRVLVYDYIKDLKRNGILRDEFLNGILISMSLDNRAILYANKDLIDDFFFEVLTNSRILKCDTYLSLTGQIINNGDFQKFIDYLKLFKKYNIREPELQDKLLIGLMDPKMYERIINYDKDLFYKIVKESRLAFVPLHELPEKDVLHKQPVNEKLQERIDNLEDFVKLIKESGVKDSYLYQECFMNIVHEPLFKELLVSYDANIKRLLKESATILPKSTDSQNLLDLLKFMKILGCFCDDPIKRQKASTFITEKIFSRTIPVKKTENNPEGQIENHFRIIGDDIHRIFNLQTPNIIYKPDYATFFIENYKEIIDFEKMGKSGFIERVYNNFERIQETCTSNRGDQRKLKVSIKKCISYASGIKFRGITPETKDLARIIGEWFDQDYIFDDAVKVYKESLNAQRNIFTKHYKDPETGQIIYDDRPECDLKEKETDFDFTFEWLPKQNYNNLVLGKYCGCCAHIAGAGQGIMRASMILDCCQNLVVRNSYGVIVAKSTIYVNRKKGYAVFNNVESNLGYRDNTSLEGIYKAFMRGTDAFIKEYNKNNQTKITFVSIGSSRNTVKDFLTEENGHPESPIKTAIAFSNYSLKGTGWAGDWKTSQRQVYPPVRVRQ